MLVEIFTDGGCHGNPGPGAWATLLRYNGKEKELVGVEALTTNNRMELMGALQGLLVLSRPSPVLLTTDSRYLKDGITQWLPRWKANGWKTAAKQPVKNQDLWEALEQAAQPHQVEWAWVKGHSGHVENERVDRLIQLALKKKII